MATDRTAFIAGLRELAMFMEEHPAIPAPNHADLYLFPDTPEELRRLARSASWDKEYCSYLTLTHEFSGGVALKAAIEREKVCRKVVTGIRLEPARPAQPAHAVETYDWVCEDLALTR